MASLEHSIEQCLDATVELLACSVLVPTCPAEPAGETDRDREAREFREAIHEMRLKSIRTLLDHRSHIARAMEARGIDSGPLFELELPARYDQPRDADRVVEVFERMHVAISRLANVVFDAGTHESKGTGSAKIAPRRGRRGPDEAARRADRIIDEAWKSGRYRNLAELANTMNLSKREVRRALDRQRKRK